MIVTELREIGKDRLLVTTDEELSFSLYRGEVQRFHITLDGSIAPDVYQRIHDEILIPRARKRVLFLLERMDRTEAQLRDKLYRSGYPEDVMDDALSYAKGLHYVDDLRYANTYIAMREEQKSRRILAADLMKKGIRREIIEQALAESYDGDREEEKIAAWLARKHYVPEEADQKERQRMAQFLMRRGFLPSDIYHLL